MALHWPSLDPYVCVTGYVLSGWYRAFFGRAAPPYPTENGYLNKILQSNVNRTHHMESDLTFIISSDWYLISITLLLLSGRLGSGASWLATGRLIFHSLPPPSWLSRYPWARHTVESTTPCIVDSAVNVCVYVCVILTLLWIVMSLWIKEFAKCPTRMLTNQIKKLDKKHIDVFFMDYYILYCFH